MATGGSHVCSDAHPSCACHRFRTNNKLFLFFLYPLVLGHRQRVPPAQAHSRHQQEGIDKRTEAHHPAPPPPPYPPPPHTHTTQKGQLEGDQGEGGDYEYIGAWRCELKCIDPGITYGTLQLPPSRPPRPLGPMGSPKPSSSTSSAPSISSQRQQGSLLAP